MTRILLLVLLLVEAKGGGTICSKQPFMRVMFAGCFVFGFLGRFGFGSVQREDGILCYDMVSD